MNIPLTLKSTQEGLKKGDFSAVELVDAYLKRIESFDKDLNAFITVTKETAYEKAKWTDSLIKNDPEGAFKAYPLLGMTIAHKDMFLTKGIRTTAASKVLESYIPPYSATVVKRLDEAGCILMGKTNQDAWAHGSSGENSDFGVTKNPWDTSKVPGGSSSGSGAAVAAHFSLAATGTDTCGSIRLPANYCGIYGLKPTYGSVSRYGVIAMASSLDSIGHMAKSVDDIVKIYSVTSGEDNLDSTVKNATTQSTKEKIKIGVPQEFFVKGLDKEVEKSLEKVKKIFSEAEFELVDVSLPTTKYAISVYYIVQPAEVSSNLGRYDGIRFGAKREMLASEAKRRIMLGTYVLSAGYYDAYYLKAMKVRTKICTEVDDVFKKVDILLAPVAPTPPFALGEKVSDPLEMYLTDIFAATANLSGIPSLAIPYGFTKDKLPLGFQIMGPRFSENTLFSIAKRFEEITDWKPQVALQS